MNYNDPFWDLCNFHGMSPENILLMIDFIEEWVINEQPEITLMEACFLTNNIGMA
tara:strand:+ start:321 stop:485 length:165 start_codon:yes stop_codon:yes gene_type:complete